MRAAANSTHTVGQPSRSLALLARGLALEVVGIVLAGLAFGPFRDSAIALAVLGIAIVYAGMFLALAGALGEVRAVPHAARRAGYLVAALAGIAQIGGLTWDNLLHARGETHFGPAHTLAEGGFALLLFSAVVLALEARFGHRGWGHA